MVVTSVRIPAADWKWVKDRRGAQFSALLAAKIHELQAEDERREMEAAIREMRTERAAKGSSPPKR
jgi:hypothetical protein